MRPFFRRRPFVFNASNLCNFNRIVSYEINTKFTIKSRSFTKSTSDGNKSVIDYRMYMDLTKLGLVWTTSLSILTFMLSSFGYSLWWHGKREQARIAGQDLDEWAEDFAANHDPVVRWLTEMGLQEKRLNEIGHLSEIKEE